MPSIGEGLCGLNLLLVSKERAPSFLITLSDVGMENKGDEVPKLSANIKKWN